MAAPKPIQPVRTTRLCRPLHRELIALLRGLDATDWDRPTTAGDWNVRRRRGQFDIQMETRVSSALYTQAEAAGVR